MVKINECRFEKVASMKRGAQEIWIDKETNVMYAFIRSSQGIGFSAMVGADGKPLVWRGE